MQPARDQSQLITALDAAARDVQAAAASRQQSEERVKTVIEADLSTLRNATFPPGPAIATALGFPLNVSERSWLSLRREAMAGLREQLVQILNISRKLRQEERKLQGSIRGLHATVTKASAWNAAINSQVNETALVIEEAAAVLVQDSKELAALTAGLKAISARGAQQGGTR